MLYFIRRRKVIKKLTMQSEMSSMVNLKKEIRKYEQNKQGRKPPPY